MSNRNYFQKSSGRPFHLSVGAVILSPSHQVACHYFEHFDAFGAQARHFYLLMRETLEPDETLEQAVARGLVEEFGMEAQLENYLGSIISHFAWQGATVEKTTLYFLGRLTSFDPTRRHGDDPEAGSQIEWHDPDYLIAKMKEQRARIGREDVDESVILERTKKLIGRN